MKRLALVLVAVMAAVGLPGHAEAGRTYDRSVMYYTTAASLLTATQRLGTVACALDNDTCYIYGASGWLPAAGNTVQSEVVSTALTEIRFCGNGPNATTATYVGPVTIDLFESSGTAVEDDFVFGGTGCDGLDNTTEGTADAPWHAALAFKPVSMVCATTCGTDDTMVFQLRDDTADVAGMTCSVTLTGSAVQCSVYDSTPATVAAGSAIAVRVVNSTDDNCSSGDLECRLFVALTD